MTGTLYIVATPIGNLEDMTLRARRVLGEVDVILCEDTRVTKKLLSRHEIHTSCERLDAHVEIKKASDIVKRLEAGHHIALVSDAGTPGISDPGARLVAYVREHAADTNITVVPGPSALTAALSIAGIHEERFTFLGFPPHKKGRKTFFESVANYDHPVVFYESSHRIIKTLESLHNVLQKDQKVMLMHELTKLHEEVITGTPHDVFEKVKENPGLQKGEYVVIVHRKI